MSFKLGRLPNDPAQPRVKLAAHLNAASPPPEAVSWAGVPQWGMLLNDSLGDCTCAGDGHIVEILSFYGQGTETVVTDAEALAAYEAVGGYNPSAGPPGDNPTDRGATVQAALSYLHDPGMAGVTVDAVAEVSVSDLGEMKTACAELGPLSAGVNLPAIAQQQFTDGQPWDVVADDGGIEGGHCIVLCGYDQDFLYFVTWGKVQKATYAWWAKYGEEIWAVVSRDWVSAKGQDPEGVDLAGLGADWAAVTGNLNPFTDAPIPAPGAAPTPVHNHANMLIELADDVEAVLAKVRGYLSRHGLTPHM